MNSKHKVSRISILKAVEFVLSSTEIRQAIVYQHPMLVVKLTRNHKPKAYDRGRTFSLTIGKPNYAERLFVKSLIKSGEPFPIKKVQFKKYKC